MIITGATRNTSIDAPDYFYLNPEAQNNPKALFSMVFGPNSLKIKNPYKALGEEMVGILAASSRSTPRKPS